MLALALAYDRHWGFLEQRVESCYQQLRDDQQENGNKSSSSYKILGDSLSELRLVRNQVKGEAQLLQERGLRCIPMDYQLATGESVVILADGEWDGTTAKVVVVADNMASSVPPLIFIKKTQAEKSDIQPEQPLERPLLPGEVAVEISPFEMIMPPIEWDDDEFSLSAGSVGERSTSETSRLLIFKQRDLAKWDYSGAGLEPETMSSATIASIPDARRRLFNILSTLSSTSEGDRRRRPSSAVQSARSKSSISSASNNNKSDGTAQQQDYRSARERKAAAKQNIKTKRKKQ
jgi:hypothetical protein